MTNVTLFKQDGSENGTVEVNEAVFGIEPNEAVVFDAVQLQMAAKRQGTHAVKNRSAVRGGGRKPWRQKGTGRARAGSTRSPIWVGGGVAFGPQAERNYKHRLPRKVARLAIKSVLSDKVANDNLVVVDQIAFETPKTKDFNAFLDNLNIDGKVLIVVDEANDNLALSSRNLQSVKVVTAGSINVLDVVHADTLIMTQDALSKVEEALN